MNRTTPVPPLKTSIRLAMGMLAAMLVAAGSPDARAAGRADPRPRDRWTAAEVAELASMRLQALGPVPSDPSNAVEDQPAAIAFGRRLFSDPGFSRDGTVSCATCHDPARQFQDGRPVGEGVGRGSRRTMAIAGAAHAPWLFWDGRKDSLWSQALGPLEDPAEHAGNRTQFVRRMQAHYRAEYEALFGPLPDLDGVPADASPLGTTVERAAWQRIGPATRQAISHAYANLGKAIAAYERTLRYGESRFDRYAQGLVDGDGRAQDWLTPQEVRGLRLFIGQGRCATCHNGPLLTDQSFHNTGVPPRDPARPDRGRVAAAARLMDDEFNCLGPFSDAPDRCDELRFMADDDPALLGAFRTPSLRNVALRPPYMHAGQFATLDDVIRHYAGAPAAAVGHSELAHAGAGHAERAPIRLSTAERRDLAAFLQALSGPILESASP